MNRPLAFAVALAASLEQARAEEIPSVVRGPEPAVVRVGDTATIVLSVAGAASTLVLARPPAVDGIDWSVGPAAEAAAQRIGVRAVETGPVTEWTISVTPRRVGGFELPALVVEEEGRPRTIAVGRLDAVADLVDDPHAFVELSAPRDRCFLGETLEITLRVGFDRDFFSASAVKTFLQPTDVLLAVESHGFDERRGGRAASGQALVLNGRPVDASVADDRTIDGRTFGVLEVSRRFTADRSGELVIPAPLVRFAWTDRFSNDPFGARVPADRKDAFVRGRPLALQVDRLPELDRPPGFTGAVGKFTIRASADRTDVAVLESLKLTVSIEGDGNLTRFAPPSFTALREFFSRGRVERRDARANVVVFDIAPRSAAVTTIPPIELVYFDPEPPGRYRSAKSDPIALVVRGDASEPAPPTPPTRRPEESWRPPLWPFPSALLVLVLVAAARRRRKRREHAARDAALADIATALGARLLSAESDLAVGLTEYLASRLGCAPAAVITPDLARRLELARIPHALAERTASTLSALVAARYGGAAPQVDAREVQQLVAELERAFISS